MSIPIIIYIVTTIAWAILALICSASVYRLFRSKPCVLDPLKTGLFFIAAMQTDLYITRYYTYPDEVWQITDNLNYMLSSIVLIFSILTAIVAIYKTDEAIKL